MNVLVVDDELLVLNAVSHILRQFGFIQHIEICNTFQSGLQSSYSEGFDIILLDIFLGKDSRDGIELCKLIRKRNAIIPIIVLTSFKSFYYLEKAFEVGASDYITKPFHPQELEIRMKRWFSSHFLSPTLHNDICYHELSYSFSNNQFHYKGKALDLTKKNKALLLLFLERKEQILTQEYIQEKLWLDRAVDCKKRNVRSNIQILRKSLSHSCGSWILTVPGEGYVLTKNKKDV